MRRLEPQFGQKDWQVLFSSVESRWKDLRRIGCFIIPIVILIFVAVLYAFVVYESIHLERWIPQNINRFTPALYIFRIIVVGAAPLIALGIGLSYIFSQVKVFIRTLYQPAENEKIGGLIRRRLLGIPHVPPPLDGLLKYPSIVLKEPVLAENHWSRWLGGPAILVIHDGIAVYLERGNTFSRVVGPSVPMPFLEQHERIKEVVDLRPQTKTDTLRPWTKDGIQLRLLVSAECQIDGYPDEPAQSTKFRFPCNPQAVKAAVEQIAVRMNSSGELVETSWLDGAWGIVAGVINTYVARHSLDELFLAPQAEASSNPASPENGLSDEIEQILSLKLREEIEKSKNILAQKGLRVLAIQITNVEIPPLAMELWGKCWESAKETLAARRNSEAEANRIRARERAHADAQREMLATITEKLRSVGTNNLTEPLILALSGVLDQGLDDPIVRPLIAKEAFAVLERVRRMLNEGF